MDIFDFLNDPNEKPQPFKIKNKLRILEFFAGYGSQSLALDRLGIEYEKHFVCEFDKHAINFYNVVHNTNFPTIDIRNVKGSDLNITDCDKFTYLLTYSFPCQDISTAGLQKSLEKGSGTRSGLLWEVERILNECEHKPQILCMENVKNLLSAKHKPHFDEWCNCLSEMGYSNFYQVLNAKDYGVAQNRERVFMVSILGNYTYKFPQPIELTKVMADYLDDEVPEKYYINNERATQLIEKLVADGKLDEE